MVDLQDISSNLYRHEDLTPKERPESAEIGKRPVLLEPVVREEAQSEPEGIVDILPPSVSHERVVDTRGSAAPSIDLKDAVHSITAYADKEEKVFIEKVIEEHGPTKP